MSIWNSFYVKLNARCTRKIYDWEKETTEHGVTLVDAPLLLDEVFGLEEVSLTTLFELAELKPNADNLVNLDCDGDKNSSLGLPIITT